MNGWQVQSASGGLISDRGNLLVPIDALQFVEGILASYDGKTHEISVRNWLTAGTMKVGSKTGTVNGKKRVYTADARIVNNRFYVPARFISDAIGGKLEWNASGQYVRLNFPQYVGGGPDSGGYSLDGLNGILYRTDEGGNTKRIGLSTVKLELGYMPNARLTATKVSEDADLITINHNHGEPASQEEVYTLFVKKGKIMRQAHARYWEFVPDDVKLHEGMAVMNDGQRVRLINEDGSVRSVWNVSKLAGNPSDSYAVEAIGEGYLVVRSSKEGLLTLIDLSASKAIVLFDAFGIDPKINPGIRYDNIRFSGEGRDAGELNFTFTDKNGQVEVYTYRLNVAQ